MLPSYLERGNSSLVYMCQDFVSISKHQESGFYLDQLDTLARQLEQLEASKTPTILIGVAYALLDLANAYPMQLSHTRVVETGGMKGRKKEITRDELHGMLRKGFGVPQIQSEYGMTELLSQAYSMMDGKFETPPWMKVQIRDVRDPLSQARTGKSGGINIIDLANLYSCSFIAAEDIGKINADGTFEVLGRTDTSEMRGCSLMVADL
ncbi:MAG: hypothetical protein HKN32_01790 [Flavobacteriales bacterium]|nr:hypothetical protein [Flavobacteriales bacterium]